MEKIGKYIIGNYLLTYDIVENKGLEFICKEYYNKYEIEDKENLNYDIIFKGLIEYDGTHIWFGDNDGYVPADSISDCKQLFIKLEEWENNYEKIRTKNIITRY